MKMIRLTIFGLIIISAGGFAESFQWELAKKRQVVLETLGEKKLIHIEEMAAHTEIYRITQLLTIPGIGRTTVLKLGEILGYRFSYGLSTDACIKQKYC